MTEWESTLDENSATVKAIGACWDWLNQIDPQVFDEWETEQEFYAVLESVRLAINELDEMGLIVWQPEQ